MSGSVEGRTQMQFFNNKKKGLFQPRYVSQTKGAAEPDHKIQNAMAKTKQDYGINN